MPRTVIRLEMFAMYEKTSPKYLGGKSDQPYVARLTGLGCKGGELVRVVNHAEVAQIDRGVVTCEICHRSIIWNPVAYRIQQQQEIEILTSLPKGPA